MKTEQTWHGSETLNSANCAVLLLICLHLKAAQRSPDLIGRSWAIGLSEDLFVSAPRLQRHWIPLPIFTWNTEIFTKRALIQPGSPHICTVFPIPLLGFADSELRSAQADRRTKTARNGLDSPTWPFSHRKLRGRSGAAIRALWESVPELCEEQDEMRGCYYRREVRKVFPIILHNSYPIILALLRSSSP